jgi:hypothetical protein
VATAGLAASRRDGRVRAAITALLNHAQVNNCTTVVIENLDFADARATGRDTMGSGKRGKRFRRIVAGIPTARFRTRLTSMATRRGIAIIGVDAAYTSMWGNQRWAKPLQQQTSEPVTRHHGAATAIGRRGLGCPISNPATVAGTAVPTHRHAHDAHRSPGKHPPPAANTVRAATEQQNSLLLTHKERCAACDLAAGLLPRYRPRRVGRRTTGTKPPTNLTTFTSPQTAAAIRPDAKPITGLHADELKRGSARHLYA